MEMITNPTVVPLKFTTRLSWSVGLIYECLHHERFEKLPLSLPTKQALTASIDLETPILVIQLELVNILSLLLSFLKILEKQCQYCRSHSLVGLASFPRSVSESCNNLKSKQIEFDYFFPFFIVNKRI